MGEGPVPYGLTHAALPWFPWSRVDSILNPTHPIPRLLGHGLRPWSVPRLVFPVPEKGRAEVP